MKKLLMSSEINEFPPIKMYLKLHVVCYHDENWTSVPSSEILDFEEDVEIANHPKVPEMVLATWCNGQRPGRTRAFVWDFEKDGDEFDIEVAKQRIEQHAEKIYHHVDYIEVGDVYKDESDIEEKVNPYLIDMDF